MPELYKNRNGMDPCSRTGIAQLFGLLYIKTNNQTGGRQYMRASTSL